MNEENKTRITRRIVVIVIIILLLIGYNCYLYVAKLKRDTEIAVLSAEKTALLQRVEYLEIKLQKTVSSCQADSTARVENLVLSDKISQLQTLIVKLNEQQEVNEKILKLLKTRVISLEKDVAKYEVEINTLESDVSKYQVQIYTLEKDINEQKSYSNMMQGNNNSIGVNTNPVGANSLEANTNSIGTDINAAEDNASANSIEVQNKSQKSLLFTTDQSHLLKSIIAYGFEQKNNHLYRVNRADLVSKILVEFKISNAAKFEEGQYDAYMQIVDASGNVVKKVGVGSANELIVDGKAVNYSTQGTITYSKKNDKYAVGMANIGVQPGTYTVQIYTQMGIAGKTSLRFY